MNYCLTLKLNNKTNLHTIPNINLLNMKKFLVIWLLIIPFTIYAQQIPSSAYAISIGGIGQPIISSFSAYYNQAALARLQSRYDANIFYRGLLNVPTLSDKAFAFAYKPWDNSAIATSYHFTGFDIYSYQRVSIAYGMRAANDLYIGSQINLHIIHQPAYYGNIYTTTAELSLLYTPSDNLIIASHIFNFWYKLVDKNIPAIAEIALAYSFSEKVFFAAELEKQIDQPLVWRWGTDYKLIKNFSLRFGGYLFNNLYTITFGTGIKYKWLDLNLGFESQPLLGLTSSINLRFSL